MGYIELLKKATDEQVSRISSLTNELVQLYAEVSGEKNEKMLEESYYYAIVMQQIVSFDEHIKREKVKYNK